MVLKINNPIDASNVIMDDGTTAESRISALEHVGRSISATIMQTIVCDTENFGITYNTYLNSINKKDYDADLAEIVDGNVKVKLPGRYLVLTETTCSMHAGTAYGYLIVVRANNSVLTQDVGTPQWSRAMTTQTASTCVLKEGDIISVGGNVHNDICDVGRAILELVYLGQ